MAITPYKIGILSSNYDLYKPQMPSSTAVLHDLPFWLIIKRDEVVVEGVGKVVISHVVAAVFWNY